jgi:hypothetical protein
VDVARARTKAGVGPALASDLLVASSGTAARGAETRRTRRLHSQGLASAIHRPLLRLARSSSDAGEGETTALPLKRPRRWRCCFAWLCGVEAVGRRGCWGLTSWTCNRRATPRPPTNAPTPYDRNDKSPTLAGGKRQRLTQGNTAGASALSAAHGAPRSSRRCHAYPSLDMRCDRHRIGGHRAASSRIELYAGRGPLRWSASCSDG